MAGNMDKDKTNHFYYSQSGKEKEDEKLLEPVKYILQVRGNQLKAKLTHAFNYWLKISNDRLQTIDEIINMLHKSCTLIDDIQDNSILRKGIPVAHTVYGIGGSLNAAIYVLFIALERIVNLQHPTATKVCMEQLLELTRGQGIEIFWRDNFICPSETDYRTMTIKKTGALFNLAIKLMKLFSICEEDFSSLVAILGLYFQVRDDYCNLCLTEYTENKGHFEDLTEGKFSFPIIHALTINPNDKQIISILKQRTKNIAIKRHCIKLLEEFGSFKYTRDVLEELDMKARAEIERLGGNPLLIKILDEMKNWEMKN